jgi:NADP-dependent 3-hydroxy acid dehydrogenase YdfG
MYNLNGKVALGTGATSGKGLSISKALIEKGVKVYLVGRKPKNLYQIKNSKFLNDENITFINADLSKDDEINILLSKVECEPKLDILIHRAGVLLLGSFEKQSTEELDHQYKVNVRSRYLITQKLMPKIKAAKGQMLFANSTAGPDSWENIGQYSSSRHASRELADSLRKALSKDKVRVTSLFFGSTATPMQEYVQKYLGNEYQPEKHMSSKQISDIVMYILGLPKEVSINDMIIYKNQ